MDHVNIIGNHLDLLNSNNKNCGIANQSFFSNKIKIDI